MQFKLVAAANGATQFNLTGPAGYTAFSNSTTSSGLITLPSSGNYVLTVHNAVGAFPHWFRPDFKQFVGKVERLPIDQHELIALVAPRALLITEGINDIWINPQGSQLTYLAAAKVYEFLGARDRISIRYRPVGHIPSNEDLLDYADHVFFGKPLTDDFGKLAYPEETRGFDWDVPR